MYPENNVTQRGWQPDENSKLSDNRWKIITRCLSIFRSNCPTLYHLYQISPQIIVRVPHNQRHIREAILSDVLHHINWCYLHVRVVAIALSWTIWAKFSLGEIFTVGILNSLAKNSTTHSFFPGWVEKKMRKRSACNVSQKEWQFTPIKIPRSKNSVPETEVVNMTGTRYYGIEKWIGRTKKLKAWML